MKIYAISDLHGNLEGLDPQGCDIVIIAGDFASLKGGGKWHIYDQKKWIEKKFISWTQRYPTTQFVVVPGNHDLCLDPSKTTCCAGMNMRISWPKNVFLLIDSWIEINGLMIYGTPWVPIINYRWAFEAEHDILVQQFDHIPKNVDILITHTPPHIGPESGLDRSLQWGGNEAFGSHELGQVVFEKKPRYVFCGHIHSGTHGGVDFCGTKIFNVSRVDERYEIAYEPEILDISTKSEIQAS